MPKRPPDPKLIYTIRVLRAACGLTQKSLADKAGMTQTRISHIEHGTVVARRTERLCIAKALDVAPESIVWPKVKLTDRQRLREAARERRQQARIEALSS